MTMLSQSVAHSLDHNFRLVTKAVMAPLQRRRKETVRTSKGNADWRTSDRGNMGTALNSPREEET